MVILGLIHAKFPQGGNRLGSEPIGVSRCWGLRRKCGSNYDNSFQLLTYQLPSVGYWPTEAVTGNGELGFDSGEGA